MPFSTNKDTTVLNVTCSYRLACKLKQALVDEYKGELSLSIQQSNSPAWIVVANHPVAALSKEKVLYDLSILEGQPPLATGEIVVSISCSWPTTYRQIHLIGGLPNFTIKESPVGVLITANSIDEAKKLLPGSPNTKAIHFLSGIA